MYLRTKTETMTIPAIRKVVEQTIMWCKKNMGTKRSDLSFKVTASDCDSLFGEYQPDKKKIVLYLKNCTTIKMIMMVTIHEYCHHLQDLRAYSKILEEVGYRNHPQEIEAKNSEHLYSKCWKSIKKKFK